MYLRGQQRDAESEVLVHQGRPGLQRPARPIALVPQRPEESDEQIDHHEVGDGLEANGAEDFLEPDFPRRRDDGVALAADPEHDGRDEHHGRGHAEGDAGPVLGQQPRAQQDGDGGAGVDRQVEPTERALDEVLVGAGELVAQVRGDAGLDTTGAQSD